MVKRKSAVLADSDSESESNPSGSGLEEGEVSSSEGDDDSSADEFDDGYDENFMGDAEDKARLMSLTEKERETEIFKRVERRDVMKTRFEIEKKLRQAKKRELKRQQKAEQASSGTKFSKVDAKERSKERKKTVEGKVDKKSQAMDLLKAIREGKKARDEEREKEKLQKVKREDADFDLDLVKPEGSTIADKSKKKVKISDIYSDDDDSNSDASGDSSVTGVKRESSQSRSESDSEVEEDSYQQPMYVENYKDLEKIRLTRAKLEKWVHFPFFARVCKGCFVRLGIGENHEKAVYRIAEVVSVVETSKIYQLGKTRTNKAFRVRHANDEREFRLEFISMNDFTESEFTKWKTTCEAKGIVLPTLQEIDRKVKELQEASNYQFNNADVDHIILEKQKFKQSPVNFAVRKTELMAQRETANQKGDEKKAEELSRAIAELDDRAKELDKFRSSSLKNISYINERNRKKNVEEAEKAILEEMRESKGLKTQDPFTRRNTKPIMVHRPLGFLEGLDTNLGSPNSASSSVKVEEPEIKPDLGLKLSPYDILNEKPISEILDLDDLNGEGDMPLRGALEEELKSGPRAFTTGDLFSAHDFEIKLELDSKLPPNLPIVARPSVQQIREPTPRRSLNLEDYKRKRGLI